MASPLAVAILAAGKGKRMKSKLPKVLFEICGRPALFYPFHAASSLKPKRFVAVVGWGADQIKEAFSDSGIEFVIQKELLGTGHALQMTRENLKDFKGDLLVLYGDGPLIKPETLQAIVAKHRKEKNFATVMTAVHEDPTGYGRIIRDKDGNFLKIVEENDADSETKKIREANTGITIYRCPEVFDYLELLEDDNEQKEFYLTDLPQIIACKGLKVGLLLHHDARELDGFNSIDQYANLRKRVQQRILASHMDNGVAIVDPDTTCIDFDVEIGKGTRILPFTVIQGKVTIGEDCSIGPFTYLRHGTELAGEVSLGSFVELKNSRLAPNVKCRHLSFIGDAAVGARTNIGAGTITANWDGKKINRTKIEDGAFIGSGTVIIAPAEIGEGSTTGAGAVITRDTRTEPGSTYIGMPARKYGSEEGNQ
ncbi:MAG: bifunctional UDP-N-acetylglucosamine diphosphorylase/glucosamine-1-phosphate N-acetyltransferase GlmU [Planctomycetota bacterium]|jgi:bifunctional UDP-N-acetylglucosamine pyrophosphorylase/glucosamine-1-phosphate N-acetyltransferase